MLVQAKSLIQTGTCLIHKEAGTEIKRHPAHFQQVSWQTRYWRGEERADCSLKTSRREIARAEQNNVLLKGDVVSSNPSAQT